MATTGPRAAVEDLAGALLPLSARDVQSELEERLSALPNQLNEFGLDPFGMDPASIRRLMLPAVLMYRHYFRVQTFDIERVPSGRMLLIANHAGQVPIDGVMLNVAMLMEAEPPRLCRAMGEYWVARIPFFNVIAARFGTLIGTPENCVRMLDAGECVQVFPEGARGMNKLWSQRYQLQRFGLGFMRLALQTSTPIVPVAIVGSEEQNPSIANLQRLADLLSMPALPITPTFPWLGPLGLMPLPVRYRIYFGEPLRFQGDPDEEDAVVERKVEVVKDAIHAMFERGLAERAGVFR